MTTGAELVGIGIHLPPTGEVLVMVGDELQEAGIFLLQKDPADPLETPAIFIGTFDQLSRAGEIYKST